ncbi:MAG TPA: hypothetical protein PLD23_20710 [Armatimonadota bacterium]|nr:hypothetical protein [Armatimonadota bacterium]
MLGSTGDGPGRAAVARLYRHGYARVFLAACLLLVAALTTVAMYQSRSANARSRDDRLLRARTRASELTEAADALEGAAQRWSGPGDDGALGLVESAAKALSRAQRLSAGPPRLRLQALQRDVDDLATLMRGGDPGAKAYLRQLAHSVRAAARSDGQ